MSRQAQLVRARVVQDLLDVDSTLYGERVFRDRARPLRKDELPCVLVYMRRETATLESEGFPRAYACEAELVTEVVTAALDGSADQADAIAQEIEQALFLDETLGREARDCRYAGCDSGLREEGDITVAVQQLRWTVEYALEAPEHRDAPDLELVGVTATIGGEGSPVEEMAIPIDQSLED